MEPEWGVDIPLAAGAWGYAAFGGKEKRVPRKPLGFTAELPNKRVNLPGKRVAPKARPKR